MAPKNKMKDVHTEHCCILHGCKYDNEHCSVVTMEAGQSFPCETCNMEGIKDIKTLNEILICEIARCPHCGHVL